MKANNIESQTKADFSEPVEEITRVPHLRELNSPEERIMNLMLDLVQTLKVAPLDLPMPTDARLKRISEALARPRL
jgi:hypothetical protein